MRQGVQGLCTGMTLRDGTGREMGGKIETKPVPSFGFEASGTLVEITVPGPRNSGKELECPFFFCN